MSAPDGIRFKSNDMRYMSLNKLLNKAVNDYIRAIEHICEHDALEKCSSILERHGWVRCDVNIDQLKAENAKLRELASGLRQCLDDQGCEGCPMQDDDGWCVRDIRLHELGVEVDK